MEQVVSLSEEERQRAERARADAEAARRAADEKLAAEAEARRRRDAERVKLQFGPPAPPPPAVRAGPTPEELAAAAAQVHSQPNLLFVEHRTLPSQSISSIAACNIVLSLHCASDATDTQLLIEWFQVFWRLMLYTIWDEVQVYLLGRRCKRSWLRRMQPRPRQRRRRRQLRLR